MTATRSFIIAAALAALAIAAALAFIMYRPAAVSYTHLTLPTKA